MFLLIRARSAMKIALVLSHSSSEAIITISELKGILHIYFQQKIHPFEHIPCTMHILGIRYGRAHGRQFIHLFKYANNVDCIVVQNYQNMEWRPKNAGAFLASAVYLILQQFGGNHCRKVPIFGWENRLHSDANRFFSTFLSPVAVVCGEITEIAAKWKRMHQNSVNWVNIEKIATK